MSVALLAIAALTMWWSREEPPIAVEPPAPLPAEAPAAPAAAAVPDEASAPERSAVAEAAPPPPATDPLLAHVRGRCVDEHGAPLAGCTAKFHGWGGNSNRMALQGDVAWQDPEPIVTGDDGRFDFGFAPPSGLQFSLDIKCDGRVPRTGRWGQLQPAQVVDLGDIPFQRGFEVRGRVVDEQNAPVAKVGVNLRNLPLPIAPDMAANNSRYGFSGADGGFRIEVPIPAGTWSLDADTRGMRLLSPDRVVVTERGAEPVLVVVRRMPSIEGLVVDELGQPVPGVDVRAELQRSGRMASGRSRQDGTFTIYAVDMEQKPVALRIDDPGPCEPPAPDPRLWDWGSKGVRFELRRAQSCELVVVERNGGAPVTRYAVNCYREKADSSLYHDLRLSGEHPDGRVTIDRLWRGKNLLRVVPLDPALLPSAQIAFDVGDAGASPLRVEIDRLRGVSVRVTTAAGAPVAGSKVEVVVKGSQPFGPDDWAMDQRGENRGWSSDSLHRFHELVATATTGADGRAAVFAPDDGNGLVVRATGEHPVAVVDPAVFAPDQDLVVVVPDSGAIAGKVLLAGLDRAQVAVLVLAPEGKKQGREPQTSLDADGAFAVRGLSPGTYELRVFYTVPFRGEGYGTTGRMPLPLTVPAVEVAAGQTVDVTIDATAIVPATVRGRVLLDGAPPAAARVVLAAERGAQFGQFVPGPDGAFEATGLLPGTYRTDLVVGDLQASQGKTIRGEETFELAAGQQLARDFAFTRRRLVITLLQTDGKTPAANVRCFCSGEGVNLPDLTTDQDGRIVLDPAPTVPVRFQPSTGRITLGPVQMPAGATSHEVTLTLPPPQAK